MSRKIVIEIGEGLVKFSIQEHGYEATDERVQAIFDAIDNGEEYSGDEIVWSCIEYVAERDNWQS